MVLSLSRHSRGIINSLRAAHQRPLEFLQALYSTTTPQKKEEKKESIQYSPVVIAGGGPTGLTTAILLARYGIPSVLLERAPTLTTHPKAHFINHRTMEVFRSMNGLAEEVLRTMPPLKEWRSFVYCTTLTGNVLGTVDHFKGQDTSEAPHYSPEPVAHLAQDKLLPLIAQRAAAMPGIDLRMGHSVVGIEEINADGPEKSGVRVQVESTDGNGPYHIDARYIVAADGAHSKLRHAIGVPMPGPGAIQHLINIHFTSPELGKALRGREGMLYFVFGPNAIAVMVAHNITTGEFVAQIPYFPPLQSAADFTPEKCVEVVRRAAGDASLPLEIRTIRPWAMSAAVAETYRKNRVLLAGDAAHVVPPSGALGMNTGIQDAHNLAWKLAAVVRGAAPDSLLDTYGAERRPVAEANMRLSVANFHETLRVAKVMGLDYETANTASGMLSSSALSWVPEGLRRGVLDAAIATGRAASGPISALRRDELAALFTTGDTLRLQYPKEDLGFVYGENGAVCYAGGDQDSVAKYCGPKPRNAPYIPVTLPGARLPHFNLKILAPGKLDLTKNSSISSIDLIPAAGLHFVLLLASTKEVPAWIEAVRQVNTAKGLHFGVCPVVIVDPSNESNVYHKELDDGVAVVEDVEGSWARLLQHGSSTTQVGAAAVPVVLVRPDGHVAWRGVVEGGAERKLAALESTLDAVLKGH